MLSWYFLTIKYVVLDMPAINQNWLIRVHHINTWAFEVLRFHWALRVMCYVLCESALVQTINHDPSLIYLVDCITNCLLALSPRFCVGTAVGQAWRSLNWVFSWWNHWLFCSPRIAAHFWARPTWPTTWPRLVTDTVWWPQQSNLRLKRPLNLGSWQGNPTART